MRRFPRSRGAEAADRFRRKRRVFRPAASARKSRYSPPLCTSIAPAPHSRQTSSVACRSANPRPSRPAHRQSAHSARPASARRFSCRFFRRERRADSADMETTRGHRQAACAGGQAANAAAARSLRAQGRARVDRPLPRRRIFPAPSACRRDSATPRYAE